METNNIEKVDELADNEMSENEDEIARKKIITPPSSSKRGGRSEGKTVPDDDADADEETESCCKKPKKNPFVWSFTDEYTILDKLYEFGGKNSGYSKSFFEFVKQNLTAEVSSTQLNDKIHRLKRRFVKTIKSSDNNIFKFVDSNQQKIFELSKRLWDTSSSTSNIISQNVQHEHRSTKMPTTTPTPTQTKLNDKLFRKYLVEMKFDMDFLSPDDLADIRKDWDELRILQNDFELKNCQFLLYLYDIRSSQNSIRPKD